MLKQMKKSKKKSLAKDWHKKGSIHVQSFIQYKFILNRLLVVENVIDVNWGFGNYSTASSMASDLRKNK